MRKPTSEAEKFWLRLPNPGLLKLADGNEIALTCTCGEVTIFTGEETMQEKLICPFCNEVTEQHG